MYNGSYWNIYSNIYTRLISHMTSAQQRQFNCGNSAIYMLAQTLRPAVSGMLFICATTQHNLTTHFKYYQTDDDNRGSDEHLRCGQDQRLPGTGEEYQIYLYGIHCQLSRTTKQSRPRICLGYDNRNV